MEILKLNPHEDLSIMAGSLIDGTGGEITGHTVIEVSKGDIKSLIKAADFTRYQPQDRLMDWSGLTVLPGLIDCHVHLALDAIDLDKAIDGWDDIEQVRVRVNEHMQDFLENGIIAVRDGGDRANIGLSARDWQLPGEFQGPYIVATGEAIYKKGSYGIFLGPGIREVAEIEREIKKLLQFGIGQLKVIQSGLVSFKEYGQVGAPQFDLEEMTRIAQLAHREGLPVMVHASGAEAVDIAVRAGVDSIEHGYFVQTETLKLMAEKGTAWIPTVAPLGNLFKTAKVYPGASLDVIKRTYEEQLKSIKKAWELGVLLGVGTDAGANQVYHGISYHEELAFYQEAGLESAQIIKAATANSAQVVGWGKMIGIIEEGKIPFILAVEGNPIDNLEALKNIKFMLI